MKRFLIAAGGVAGFVSGLATRQCAVEIAAQRWDDVSGFATLAVLMGVALLVCICAEEWGELGER